MAGSPTDTILLCVIIFILVVANYSVDAMATEYSAEYSANNVPSFFTGGTEITGSSPGIFGWIDSIWTFLVIMFGVLVWSVGAPAWINLLLLMPLRIAGYLVFVRIIRGVGS